MEKIKVAVAGYGGLGKAIVKAVDDHSDIKLVRVFSQQEDLKLASIPVSSVVQVKEYTGQFDVLLLSYEAGGDSPQALAEYCEHFNLVANAHPQVDLARLLDLIDGPAQQNDQLALLGVSLRPGLMSLQDILAGTIIKNGTSHRIHQKAYTDGLTQTLKQMPGVLDAAVFLEEGDEVQESIDLGQKLSSLPTRQLQKKKIYLRVVETMDDEEDLDHLTDQVLALPNFLADETVEIEFVYTEIDLNRVGLVDRLYRQGEVYEDSYDLRLSVADENLALAHLMLAGGRAVHRLSQQGHAGATSLLDLPPYLLAEDDRDKLLNQLF